MIGGPAELRVLRQHVQVLTDWKQRRECFRRCLVKFDNYHGHRTTRNVLICFTIWVLIAVK